MDEPIPTHWTKLPPPPDRHMDEVDLYDHHVAVLRCVTCEYEFEAAYPAKTNPLRIRCPQCGERGVDVAKYLKYIYRQ